MTASAVISTQFVYAIRAPRSGLIKIGISTDPKRRQWSLEHAAGERLELLGSTQGDWSMELELHARFRAFRARGEWFAPDSTLLAWVDTLDPPCPPRKESSLETGLRDGSLPLEAALEQLLHLAFRFGQADVEDAQAGASTMLIEHFWPGWPTDMPLDIELEYEDARHVFLAALRKALAPA